MAGSSGGYTSLKKCSATAPEIKVKYMSDKLGSAGRGQKKT